MKIKVLAGFVALAVATLCFTGCSTPTSVGHLEGRGVKQVYDANYDQVWRAAVAAAQTGDLQVLKADKKDGFISAKRGLRPETFGENVAIWVHSVAPGQTQVEVVSRQAGPPVLMFRTWEHRILDAISADLTTT